MNLRSQIIISNCYFSGNIVLENGGSIYLYQTGNILIENNVFLTNKAKIGGSIYYYESGITFLL